MKYSSNLQMMLSNPDPVCTPWISLSWIAGIPLYKEPRQMWLEGDFVFIAGGEPRLEVKKCENRSQ